MDALKAKIPWEFHFKALIQAKGFLKIIQFFLAIITFSILASYTAETGVGLCVENSTANINTSIVISSRYPFDEFDYVKTVEGGDVPQPISSSIGTPNPGISRQAMLFVAWGVITLFYCLVAVGVYVTTMAKADDLGKIYIALVYTDFGFTILWCFMWLVVSAEWASGQYRLLNTLQDQAFRASDCAAPSISVSDALTLLQSNIAVVFGFLNLFVWLANIWWVLIDCPMYLALRQKMCSRRADQSYDTQ